VKQQQQQGVTMALAFTDQKTNNTKKEEQKQEEVNQGHQQPRTISNSN
jgi:hypothetical protein